ncbi:MAG TPA: cyclic nucleotide-binding domain-containing protein, partial [Desulfitobacterium dehalogenans]|nr:cyclic nucleotide-binding domain-containing protein [Desulfitobacterium dehalogenans]
MNEKLHLLSKVPFLADLSQQDRIECAHEFYWEIYPQGTVLIEAGKKPAAVYILEEGKLDSEDKVLGMVSLVTGKAATETIRSLEAVRLLTIKAEDFARILLRWPQ